MNSSGSKWLSPSNGGVSNEGDWRLGVSIIWSGETVLCGAPSSIVTS